MPDIVLEFPVNAPPERVFTSVSTPEGLDQWWTLRSSGRATGGASYTLDFGPDSVWNAAVTECVVDRRFELTLTEAHEDWTGTRVGFELTPQGSGTAVKFYHLGWPWDNAHYRTSCYCWAMYLRLLKRHLEHGEFVPYERRLEA